MKGAPEIKRYMYKRLNVRMNSNRNVIGALKGYDAYMNMVLEDAVEVVSATEFNRIGTVVRPPSPRQFAARDRDTALIPAAPCAPPGHPRQLHHPDRVPGPPGPADELAPRCGRARALSGAVRSLAFGGHCRRAAAGAASRRGRGAALRSLASTRLLHPAPLQGALRFLDRPGCPVLCRMLGCSCCVDVVEGRPTTSPSMRR